MFKVLGTQSREHLLLKLENWEDLQEHMTYLSLILQYQEPCCHIKVLSMYVCNKRKKEWRKRRGEGLMGTYQVLKRKRGFEVEIERKGT